MAKKHALYAFLSIMTAATLLSLTVILLPGQGEAFSWTPKPPSVREVKLSVKFVESVSNERIDAILDSEGAQVDRYLGNVGIYIIIVTTGESEDEVVERFTAYEEVKFAERSVAARPLAK